ncbi:MAG: YceI family protein [Steroidobacteraceae bacterium]
MKRILTAAVLSAAPGLALAAPVAYELDPTHTYPSFEADHLGGLSTWRGKFNRSSGRFVIDREAKTGSVEVAIDVRSIDFGNDELNAHALTPEMFDATRYPAATFKGTVSGWTGDRPAAIAGELTLRGVTRPVTLTVNSFHCRPHPMAKKEVCGADAVATFNRADFGLDFGAAYGFRMDVLLRIQAEGLRAD